MTAISKMSAKFKFLTKACEGQRLSLIFAAVLIPGVYMLSLFMVPGWFTYALSTGALIPIFITCLVRANDIGPDKMGMSWNARRIGLVLAAAAAIGLIFEPFTVQQHGMLHFPSWREVLFRWGVMLIWLTTPNMPPWARYMFSSRFAEMHPYWKDPK